MVAVVACLSAPLRPQGADTVPGRLAMVTLACDGTSNLISIDWLRRRAETKGAPYYVQVTNEGRSLASVFGPGPGWLGSVLFRDVPPGTMIDDYLLRTRARWAACLAVTGAALALAGGLCALTDLASAILIALCVVLSFAGVASLGQGLWQQTAALPWYVTSLATALWVRRVPRVFVVTVVSSAIACWLRPADAVFAVASVAIGGADVRWSERNIAWIAGILLAALVVSLGLGGWYYWYFDTFLPTAQWGANKLAADEVFRLNPAQVLTALAGLLFSPGRGLLFFAPTVVLAMGFGLTGSAATRTLRYPLLFAIVSELLVASAFHKWWGGIAFGPRLLSTSVWFSSPLLVVGAAPEMRLRRLSTATALAYTACIGLAGLWFHDVRKWELPNDPDHHAERLFWFRRSQWATLFGPIPQVGVALDAPPGPFLYCAPSGLRAPY